MENLPILPWFFKTTFLYQPRKFFYGGVKITIYSHQNVLPVLCMVKGEWAIVNSEW